MYKKYIHINYIIQFFLSFRMRVHPLKRKSIATAASKLTLAYSVYNKGSQRTIDKVPPNKTICDVALLFVLTL